VDTENKLMTVFEEQELQLLPLGIAMLLVIPALTCSHATAVLLAFQCSDIHRTQISHKCYDQFAGPENCCSK